jgi:hypothetical protein
MAHAGGSEEQDMAMTKEPSGETISGLGVDLSGDRSVSCCELDDTFYWRFQRPGDDGGAPVITRVRVNRDVFEAMVALGLEMLKPRTTLALGA